MEKTMEIAPPRLNPRKRDTVAVLMRLAERRDLPLGEEDVTCLQQAARWLLNKVFQHGRATARKRARKAGAVFTTPPEVGAMVGNPPFADGGEG